MTPKPWLPLALLAAGCGSTVPASTVKTAPLQHEQGDSWSLDFYPASELDSKLPLVVFVHGGAWKGGSRHEFRDAAVALQREGIAAASVDYRLSPEVEHPAHADDVAHALAWLAANGPRLGFDPKRIFVVGHSAGAHIAATLATDATRLALAPPAGFVGLEGIYDIPNLAARWPTYPGWFLDQAFGKAARWPGASPTRLKPVSKAPWLLVHSKADELVDPPQTEDFARHLRDAGVRVDSLSPDGKTHDGVVQSLATPGDEVTKAIVAFVKDV